MYMFTVCTVCTVCELFYEFEFIYLRWQQEFIAKKEKMQEENLELKVFACHV